MAAFFLGSDHLACIWICLVYRTWTLKLGILRSKCETCHWTPRYWWYFGDTKTRGDTSFRSIDAKVEWRSSPTSPSWKVCAVENRLLFRFSLGRAVAKRFERKLTGFISVSSLYNVNDWEFIKKKKKSLRCTIKLCTCEEHEGYVCYCWILHVATQRKPMLWILSASSPYQFDTAINLRLA